jgi:hypothetical protein
MPDRLFSVLDRALSIVQGGLGNEGLAWLLREPRAKLAALKARGPLPALPASPPSTVRPITFVAVRYDDLTTHNLLASPDLDEPARRLVLVDDPYGLRYGSLSRALAAGIDAAGGRGPGILALVGQDVWLPAGWPRAVESALASLEAADPDWGIVGIAGTDAHRRRVGHVSDPWGLLNTFDRAHRWTEAEALEDAVLLLRGEGGPTLDPELPGFEGVGVSLAQRARATGRRCYVINAPAVVEGFDLGGQRIARATGSRRVRANFYRQQRVQRQVTLEYLAGPGAAGQSTSISAPLRWTSAPRSDAGRPVPPPGRALGDAVDHPLVLLGKGGGGSRLLSVVAVDCGVFVGRVNVSGDCLEMVPAVYSGVLRALDCRAPWQRDRVVEGLRQGALAMLRAGWSAGEPWGFKVPEGLLLVRQIHAAFPDARFLLMTRHPVATCLRRSHMTAEPDNPIGRVSLSAAYEAAGLEPQRALADPIEVRSAVVTLHQVGSAVRYLRSQAPADRYLEIHFEDVVARPADARARVAAWLGVDVVSQHLERAVDGARARHRTSVPADTVRRIEAMLAPLTKTLGYDPLQFPNAEDRG